MEMAGTRWVLVIMLEVAAGWLFPPSASLGTFTPMNGKVCTGRNITYTCRLNADVTRGTSADLVIKRKGELVDPDQIQIRDNRTILYTLQNLETAGEKISLMCCLKDCKEMSNRVGVALGESLLVFQMPQQVKNMTCVAYDWDQKLNCTWDLVVDYSKDPNVADINMYMTIENYSEPSMCPELGENHNECVWSRYGDVPAADFDQTDYEKMEIGVMIKSQCGLSINTSFNLLDVKYIQPAAANLSLEVVNATCVNVTIKSQTLNNRDHKKNYRLTYKYQLRGTDIQLQNTTQKLIVKETEETRYKPSNETVCGLTPFAGYTFSVEVSPQNEDKWEWSNPTSVTVETPPTLPGASPTMLPGMFSWKRTDCLAKYDMRMVHVYIQPIKERDWNGERRAISYKYKSTSDDDYDVNEKPADVMYTSLRLQCDLEYEVSVQVRTKEGLSPDNSTIHIPAAGQVLYAPEFILETTNRNGVVTFEWIGEPPVKGYSLYQCRHNAKQNCDDRSAIQEPLLVSMNRHTVLVSVGDESNVLIGASIQTDEDTSGIRWESCIYKQDGVPRKPTLKVEVGSDDNSLYVTWEKLLCRPGEPYVNKYWVSYCKLNSDEHCMDNFTIEVPSDQASIMLRDLNAEHKYSVYIKGIARNGHQGYSSDEVIKQPIDDSLKGGAIAGIVVGCVFGFAFAVAGVIFIVRRCGKRAKKTFTPTKIDNMIIDRPSIPTEDDEEDQGQGPWENNNQGGDSKPDEGPDGDGDLRVKLEQKPVKEFNRQRSNDSGLPQSPTDDGYVKAYVHPNSITRIPYSLDYQQNFTPGPQVIIDMNVGHATFQPTLPPVQDQTLQKDVLPNSDVGDETARKYVWTRPGVVDLSRDEDGVGDETARKEVWTRPGVVDLSRDGDDLTHVSEDEESLSGSGHCLINTSKPEIKTISNNGNNMHVNGKPYVLYKTGKIDANDSLGNENNDEENSVLLDSGYVLASCSAEGELELSKPEKDDGNKDNKLMSGGSMTAVSDLTTADQSTEMSPLTIAGYHPHNIPADSNQQDDNKSVDGQFPHTTPVKFGYIPLDSSHKPVHQPCTTTNTCSNAGIMPDDFVSQTQTATDNPSDGHTGDGGYLPFPHDTSLDSSNELPTNTETHNLPDGTAAGDGYLPLPQDTPLDPSHPLPTNTETHNLPDGTAAVGGYLPLPQDTPLDPSHQLPTNTETHNIPDDNTEVAGYLPHISPMNHNHQPHTVTEAADQADRLTSSSYLPHSTSLGLQQQNTEAGSSTQTNSKTGMSDYLPHNTSLDIQSQNTEASRNTQTDTNTGMGDYHPHNTSLGLQSQNTEADSNTQTDNTGMGDYLPHNTSLGLQQQNTEADSNTQTDNNTGMGEYLPHNTPLGLQLQNAEAGRNTQADTNIGVGDYLPHNTPPGLQLQNTEVDSNTLTDNTGVGNYLQHNTSLGLPLHNTEATVGFGYQPISNSQGPESNLYVTGIPGEGKTPVTSDIMPPEMQAGVNSSGYVSSDQGPGYIDEGVMKRLSGVDSLQSPDSDSGCSSLTSNTDALPEIPTPQCFAD